MARGGGGGADDDYTFSYSDDDDNDKAAARQPCNATQRAAWTIPNTVQPGSGYQVRVSEVGVHGGER